ncbi:ABC transporter ATP-binding protein [Paludibacterium purpuratum]|uniref:Iron complex transport system ATP-binding protein n=1 Tax=Paludibacterium purpuratum TaxID=1144873 RepID=A0A4R7BDM8_9NEIS|nr:ABC transporter ATP-binding protein [Paludibacterium purpuratum]TDR82853.1 iron complex transport system ATP-binding protein [Paludibacterium purpuratum]
MLSLRDIRVRSGAREILAVPALDIDTRQMTVILGHNGSGKSTLLRLMARQSVASQGRITLHGKPMAAYGARELARRLAFLPQNLPAGQGLTVRELVGLGRYPWRGLLGRWQAADHAAVRSAMKSADIASLADNDCDLLSGGERQRAWIAMLLAQDAPLLLLDEPTSALDLGHQYALLRLLRRLNVDRHRGVITVLHDLNLACAFADRIVALQAGRVAFDGAPTDFLRPERLSRLYGIDIDLLARPGGLPQAVVRETA